MGLETGLKTVLLSPDDIRRSLQDDVLKLYETPYSDTFYIRIYKNLSENQYYKLLIYNEKDALQHIILFTVEKKDKQISVLNDCIELSDFWLKYISDILFASFGEKKIIFNRILTNIIHPPPRLLTLFNFSSDAIIDLPDSMDKYYALLGTKTRQHVKNYQRRFTKEVSGNKIEFKIREKISSELVSKIIDLNRERMKYKGYQSGIDNEYRNRIYQYVQQRGCLCLCFSENVIVSGTINYIIGENAFLHVIAHDNRYNKYNVGQIALINTIRYLIERKVKRFHLLWGSHEYKDRFLCVRYPLYKIVIFNNFCVQYIIQVVNFNVQALKKEMKQKLKNTPFFVFYKKIKVISCKLNFCI
jgi:hypothetical protein